MPNKLSWVFAKLKNAKQRGKQILAAHFPSQMRDLIFKNLKNGIVQFPIPFENLENEVVFVGRLLVDEAIVFDVGANRGDYIFAFALSGKTKQIHAFEPIPELAVQLKRMFPEANVHQLALSSSPGESVFRIPYINDRYFDTRGTLEHHEEDEQTHTKSIQVKLSTLDLFCAENGIEKLDFIKIDVEGHEWSVLKGAKATLEKFRPLCLVEIEQRHHIGVPISEITSWIEKLGYGVYFYMPIANRFEPFERFNGSVHQNKSLLTEREKYINNFFFVPQEKSEEVIKRFAAITSLREAGAK